MTEHEVEKLVQAEQKAAKNRGLGWLVVAFVLACLTGGVGWSVDQAKKADIKAERLAEKTAYSDRRIGALEIALKAQREQFELCQKKIAKSSECQMPVAPEILLDPNDPEVQEYEIQEREIQESERQEAEKQEAENPDAEVQDFETNDADPNDADPNDPEIQDEETQDAEVQDEEIQDAEIQESEVPESWTFTHDGVTYTCSDPDGDNRYTCSPV